MLKLITKENERELLSEVEVADSLWKRFRGLMFRRELPKEKGLLLRPSNSIHTFFMRFPIDVIFINKNNQVIKITEDMKPNRITKIVLHSAYIIESNANVLSRRLKVGDQLKFVDTGKKEGEK